MDMSGEYRIAAPRQTVWNALNDPDVLKHCIPGCEELEKTGENELTAKVRTKIGPVSARFAGRVKLVNLDPPASYTIEGEGQGGAAGFAKGGADVRLAEDGDATILTYTARASIGGKLAQLGGRLIDGTARKMADQFFGRFAELVGGSAQPAAPEAAATAAPETPAPPPPEPVPVVGAEAGPPPAERLVPAAEAPAAPPAPEAPAEPPPVPQEPATAVADAAMERHIDATVAQSTEMVPPQPTGRDPETRRPAPTPPPPAREPATGMSPITWITGLVVLVLVIILIYTMT